MKRNLGLAAIVMVLLGAVAGCAAATPTESVDGTHSQQDQGTTTEIIADQLPEAPPNPAKVEADRPLEVARSIASDEKSCGDHCANDK